MKVPFLAEIKTCFDLISQVMFREDMATFKKRVRQTVRKSQEDM
jgi:hypothetical protein